MSDLQSKTDEELNVMLAGLRGWKFWQNKYDTWVATTPFGAELAVPGTIEQAFDTLAERLGLPRYTSSLDEVARVEAGLTDEQRRKYFERLIWEPCDEAVHKIGWNWADMDDDDYITALFANPRQRTIALIQTLIFNSRSYGHAKPSPPIPPSPSNPPNHQNELEISHRRTAAG